MRFLYDRLIVATITLGTLVTGARADSPCGPRGLPILNRPGQVASCIIKTAEHLALASDNADTVTKAVVRACDGEIRSEVEDMSKRLHANFDQYLHDRKVMLEDDARLAVVEARADHCGVPQK